MKKRDVRRRYPVVNRSHQYRFLAMILIYNIVIVAFFGVAIFVPDFIQLQNENLSLEVRAAIAEKILSTHVRLWPALIALLCVIGLHSFRIFHRFVGPLYRLTWAFEQIRKGDLSFRVRLRKKDYLHQEEEVLNEMIDLLAEKTRSTQLAGLDAMKSLGELERGITEVNDWSETHNELLHGHRKHVERLMDMARYFRLDKGDEEPDGQGPDD